MATQPTVRVTEAEYLEHERYAETKSEYRDGEIVPMPGVTRYHSLLAGNFFGALWSRLRGTSCEVHASDLRVRVAAGGLYTYPDVTVLCGPAIYADDRQDTVTNPIVIVEVLSDSTEAYDRGEKFWRYRQLTSLTSYILVSQHKVLVEQYVRQPNQQWIPTELVERGQRLAITSIACDIPVAEIYDRVEL